MLTIPVIPLSVRQANTDIQPSRDLPEGAFTFVAEASNSRLDAYFTHMDRSTLENFERAGIAGVVLLDSHDGRKLGVGYSAGARLYQDEGGEWRLEMLFYIVPGIKLGGIHSYASTDDYIRAIEAGIVRDVSVGFSGGRWVCDICGRDYFTGGCPHLLGLEYEIDLGEGPTQIKTATAAIVDAELSEVSLVFDGATPGAEIVEKAQRLILAGEISELERVTLETAYRTKLGELPTKAINDATDREAAVEGVNMTLHTDRDVETEVEETAEVEIVETEAAETEIDETIEDEVEVDETETELDETELDEVETETELDETELDEDIDQEIERAIETARLNGTIDRVLAEAANPSESIRALAGEIVKLEKQVERLAPLADMGRAYHADLIDQAIKEGIRAQGNSFPEETYRAMLANAPIEHIKSVIESFGGVAYERYPGGRISDEAAEFDEGGNNAAKIAPEIPATAYGA